MAANDQTFQLLLRLCRRILGEGEQVERDITGSVNYASRLLSSRLGGPMLHDDLHQIELIKRALVRNHRTQDAVRVDDIYGRLVRKSVLKCRPQVIQFLWALADLDGAATQSAPAPVFLCEALPPRPHDGAPVTSALLSELLVPRHESPPVTLPASSLRQRLGAKQLDTGEEIPEAPLLRDLVFVLQGIDGRYVRFDQQGSVVVDPAAGVSASVRDLIETRLGPLGKIYRQLRALVDTRLADPSIGLVAQCFYGALQAGLAEYYRLLAVLEDQLAGPDGGLTLRRLLVWTFEPLHRLQVLSALAAKCKGEKGGRLVSAVNSFSSYGDPLIKTMVCDILAQVSQPLYLMMAQWVYEGTLVDPFGDFFVKANDSISDVDERLWTEKHTLDASMVPDIISVELAQKVLGTGKSLHLIRTMGGDHHDVVDPAVRRRHQKGFCYGSGALLAECVQYAYRVVSARLLGLFCGAHGFTLHLAAVHRYLLLAQGEFIQTLMNHLTKVLEQPASSLHVHSLAGHLEAAIRSTNAQFDDPRVLSCLDVRLFEASASDTGWDVFSLHYKVGHPINVVFTAQCRRDYLRLFNFLWRLKRLEQCLAAIWQLATTSRPIREVPELRGVLHSCFLLRGQMLHFVSQMQYFLMFEVLECSWADLQKKLSKAEDLDQLIAAHSEFLTEILNKSLLGAMSTELLLDMRQIGGIILKFNQAARQVYEAAETEANERRRLRDIIRERERKGMWGMTAADEQAERERIAQFVTQVVAKAQARMDRIHATWTERARRFINQLTAQRDLSLRLLASRLDFNEYYRKDTK